MCSFVRSKKKYDSVPAKYIDMHFVHAVSSVMMRMV